MKKKVPIERKVAPARTFGLRKSTISKKLATDIKSTIQRKGKSEDAELLLAIELSKHDVGNHNPKKIASARKPHNNKVQNTKNKRKTENTKKITQENSVEPKNSEDASSKTMTSRRKPNSARERATKNKNNGHEKPQKQKTYTKSLQDNKANSANVKTANVKENTKITRQKRKREETEKIPQKEKVISGKVTDQRASQRKQPRKEVSTKSNKKSFSPPLVATIDNVECIMGFENGLYRIRWKGATEDDDSWIDKENLKCDEMLRKFEKRRKLWGGFVSSANTNEILNQNPSSEIKGSSLSSVQSKKKLAKNANAKKSNASSRQAGKTAESEDEEIDGLLPF